VKRYLLAGLLLASTSSAVAAPVYDDRIEDYTVIAGDTISGITKRLLGEETFWEDNWKLNPQVRDPDLLRIGQRLRIITSRRVIAEAAQVIEAVNRTEKMIIEPRWQPASAGDTLSSGQGLRTRERSTAELRFNAESSLRLGEFSQVFMAKKETTLRGVDRGSIKVEQGDVDLRFAPIAKPKTRIELIAGPATTTPVITAGKPTELRSGATEDGGARVMVFAGKTDVAAGGSAVAVAEGMGTRVPDAGPPLPPEKLLAAPTLEQPAISWNYSNGIVRWQPVVAAASYVLTVCADPECAQIRQRRSVEASVLKLQLEPLPEGLSHWRVHAVSANGLDGYPSQLGSITVTDARPDTQGPMLTLRPVDGFVEAADGSLRLGPQAELAPVAFDEQSGLQRIEIETNGEWQPVQGERIKLRDVGPDGFRLRAIDNLDQASPVLHYRLGRESEAAPITANAR